MGRYLLRLKILTSPEKRIEIPFEEETDESAKVMAAKLYGNTVPALKEDKKRAVQTKSILFKAISFP